MLTALGQLWLTGLPIDWPRLHRHEQRAHVVLPTYPFERQRHWVDPPTVPPVIPPAASVRRPDGPRDVADWFSVPSWRRQPPPRASAASNDGQRILVFLDKFGLGRALATLLAARGNDVITVTPGVAFARTGEASFEVHPAKVSDYVALLAMLAREERAPRRVVHLWGVEGEAASAVDAARFERAQESGFLSVLSLSQALAAQQTAASCDLVLVTSGGQAVRGDEALRPEVATALGACKVIPQEYPNLRWRSVDIELPAPGTAALQPLLEQLLADLLGEVAEPVTAYRGGYRW
ncbi:MAG TPA: polyketide synthase, partial [Chloroflexota bacterium]|nr:polyketide synthase [Chloroflexota bacterium]